MLLIQAPTKGQSRKRILEVFEDLFNKAHMIFPVESASNIVILLVNNNLGRVQVNLSRELM